MGVKYDPKTKKWSIEKEVTYVPTKVRADGTITVRGIAGGVIPPDVEVIDRGRSNTDRHIGSWYVDQTLEDVQAELEKLKKWDFSYKETRDAYDQAQKKLDTIINTKRNQDFDEVVKTAYATNGGDYVTQRNKIKALSGLTDNDKKIAEDYFKAFYRTEKLQPYDEKFLKQPPYGEFDASYYKTLNPALTEKWNQAVANDDIDITERYGERNFYWKDYTDTGAAKGLRANEVEATQKANEYKETGPTDAEIQLIRDKQLGVAGSLAAPKTKDLQDKTELESAFEGQVSETTKEDLIRFGALRQNVLKDTIAEMKKAKAKEQELALYKGLPGYGEIFDINQTIADSILGDTGVGGVLSYMGQDPEESLIKQLKGVTGVNNNTTYNWQQWFDNALKEKYGNEVELGYTTIEGAEEKIKVDGEFARSFIDTYLAPRFNTSKSMDEFIDYIDVKENEQNPFQTEDAVSAAKRIAEVKAKTFLDGLKTASAKTFDPTFYFNPSNNKATDEQNLKQAQTVEADWQAAKNGDPEWQKQAYRYGIDVNDKAAFARLHYQVKGQFAGYDPAEDIFTAKKISDYIYKDILPAVSQEMLNQKTIFGQFITPEEFADSMLEGVDPSNKPEWEKVLKQYGVDTLTGNINDIKEFIKDTIRSGNAKQIREQIKFLNQRKEKPRQELLGITYIERPSDLTATSATPQTELYKTFQQAGFKGSEDEFYNRFFPDLDRSEQIALTKAGTGKGLQMKGLDLSDPLSSLGTMESFFGEDQGAASVKKDDTATPESSYFKLGIEDEEEDYTKSKSGQGFLDEFTSMFKGFD